MLSNKTLRNIPEYSRAYKTNLPFYHIVMDDFFRDDTIEKLLDEVEFIEFIENIVNDKLTSAQKKWAMDEMKDIEKVLKKGGNYFI